MCRMYTYSKWIKEEVRQKGTKFIFVGYWEDTKAYKLYDTTTKKVIITYDVHFVENEASDGSIKKTFIIVSLIALDDMTGEVVHTPHVSQNVEVPPTPRTVQHVTTQVYAPQVTTQDTRKHTKSATKSSKQSK